MNEPEESKTVEKTKSYTGILIVISILLLLILGAVGYQTYSTYQRNQLARERAEAALIVANLQSDLISNLLDDYYDDAYGGNVDRIAEQQLIATQYNLVGLQLLAQQNVQIIELLANQP